MAFSITTKLDLKRFFVGEGPLTPPYYLSHRRVYILPTKQGMMFALLLFIMLLGSINYSNSLGYFLTFLLASLSVVTIFHTYNNLLHLNIGPAICKPVYAADSSGKNSSFTIQIDNRQYPARFSLHAFTPQRIQTIQDLQANALNSLEIQHNYPLRGLNPLPRFTLESRFPFGLFRAWSLIQLDQTQLVYPQPSTDKTLPAKSSGYSEGHNQQKVGVDDFKSLRSYVEGDPLQHVHWKSFARHHTLQTKEFSSATSNELWINWSDTTVTGTERKLSQLTRWVLLADKANLNYGLALPGTHISPASGQHHLNLCLKQLALFNNNETVA